jgi:peroxin-5
MHFSIIDISKDEWSSRYLYGRYAWDDAGQCNADGTQMGAQSTNPFRNMMNQLVMDQGRQRQQMPGFMQVDPNQAQLNDVMKMMDNSWQDSKMLEHQQREMMAHNAMRMEHAFAESRMVEEDMKRQHAAMQGQWQEAIELQTAKEWQRDFIHNDVLKNKADMLEGAFSEAESKVNTQDHIETENTENLMALMQNDPDPRFQNSKFLELLHKVKTGEYELDSKANELKVHPEKHVPMRAQVDQMQGAFKHAGMQEEEMTESSID